MPQVSSIKMGSKVNRSLERTLEIDVDKRYNAVFVTLLQHCTDASIPIYVTSKRLP